MAIQVFTELHRVHFTYGDVSLYIEFTLHTENDNGQFVLVNRFNEPLIPKVPDSYKKYARHYFLIPSNALSVSSDYSIPHSWSLPGIFLILESYDPLGFSLCMYVCLTD